MLKDDVYSSEGLDRERNARDLVREEATRARQTRRAPQSRRLRKLQALVETSLVKPFHYHRIEL